MESIRRDSRKCHLVSASSWSDARSATSSTWPSLTNTTRLPSSKPPLITRVFSGGSRCFPSSQNIKDKKSCRFFLFLGLGMNFPHCFGTEVDGPWILTSSEPSSATRRALLLPLIVVSQYWSKTTWTSLQVVSGVVMTYYGEKYGINISKNACKIIKHGAAILIAAVTLK